MTQASSSHWLGLLQAHGAWAVFAGVFLESLVVPLPSPPLVMGAGAFLIPAGLGWKGAFLPMLTRIALPGAAATTLGAYAVFGLAYWGGKPLIDRFGRFLGIDWDGVQKVEKRLAGRADIMIFITRALPIFPLAVISAAAGVLRLPLTGFTTWTLAGAVLRCLMLGYIGFLTRDAYDTAARKLGSVEMILGAGAALAALAAVFWVRGRMRRASP